MASNRDLPEGLRPPANGDLVSVAWRADIGAGVRVGEIASVLHDLDTVVLLGERWGVTFAQTATQYRLISAIGRRGPESLAEHAEQAGFDVQDAEAFTRFYLEGIEWRPRRRGVLHYPWPDDLIRTVADAEVPDVLGTPIRVQQVGYRNPLEVTLLGSGFLLVGVIEVLRLIRDWSSKRRASAAAAEGAEATARKMTLTTDLPEWLIEEARAGRNRVPPAELLNAVTTSDLEALNRLAARDQQLQLPQ